MARMILLMLLVALGGCAKSDAARVPCTHENDRAAWAQSQLSVTAYDSAMRAQGKRCAP